MGPPQRNEKKGAPIIKDDYGNIVNPYIPRFIVKTPWYVAAKGGQAEGDVKSPLDHQRVQSEEGRAKTEIKDPQKEVLPAHHKTYQKGACANCGAVTHRTEECVERPRARGARWTGEVDGSEVLFQAAPRTGFAAKRDRWKGYDPEKYLEVMETRKAGLVKKTTSESDDHSAPDSASDSDDAGDLKLNKGNKHLRIREDTVKYLKDLRSDSAAYDPKTRSMRDGAESAAFVPSDPSAASQQVFAWQAERESKRRGNLPRPLPPTTAPAKTEEERRRLGVDGSLARSSSDHRYNY